VPTAFVSYAHEDQEFVLALVERLQDQGLNIRYDNIALQIGDSLLRTITREITEGDFLIAVVSPDSVKSEWCQTELSLAATQGINERRVKVLPVKFRGAAMPPLLQDSYWANADEDDLETLARRLSAAMTANVEGRENDAEEAAAQVERADGQPAHAEVVGDADVRQIDEVAEKTWDLLAQWEECRNGAPTAQLQDKQRRLAWALEPLPERVRVGLPLVTRLSVAEWGDYFRVVEPAIADPDIRAELQSVRAQVAQGLEVTHRWTIDADMGQMNAGRRDAVSYLWQIRRGDDTRRIQVFISGTAMDSGNDGLPQEVAQAKDTHGRSVVATLIALDEPPEQVMVTTAGVSLTLPD